LDPAIAFGAPVVAGTATRTDIVAGLVRVCGPEAAAEAYRINAGAAVAADRFEAELAAAA
jgi:uncharacterized protein (DUF433 family)